MYTPFPTYRPLILPREIPRRIAGCDGYGCPHTSSVRYCPCGPFATHPCRPTACTKYTVPSPSSSTANFKLQTPNSSYTFSAKERDVETGLSYFGARYYSSDLSIWLSVDPMSDKYPNESPYVYCGNAPILLKDPNGREKINAFGKHNKTHSDASNRYKDNVPVIHLWAHGNNKMMQTFNPKTDEPQFVRNADDMHAFLCEHSDIYQSNSDNNKTSILVLHSCQTGKGENNIAQQLSSELDLLVVAPSENVYNRTQNAGTAQEFTCEIGVNSTYTDKNGKTQVGKRGSWNIYYKGIMVDSFDGHTKPNFKDPQKIIDKYEKKYQKIMSTDQ